MVHSNGNIFLRFSHVSLWTHHSITHGVNERVRDKSNSLGLIAFINPYLGGGNEIPTLVVIQSNNIPHVSL